MARKPKQERAKVTVNAIIESGFISLKNNGFEGSTTKRIAEIAGVSVGSIYEYFDDKDDIFRAMIQLFVNDNIDMLKETMPTIMPLTVDQAIRTLLYKYRDVLQANDGRYLQILYLQGHFEIEDYIKQTETVLMDLIMKYAMHNPEYLKIPDLLTTFYVLINGAVFSVIRYLIQPTAHIEFDKLVDVIVSIVNSHVTTMLAQQAEKE